MIRIFGLPFPFSPIHSCGGEISMRARFFLLPFGVAALVLFPGTADAQFSVEDFSVTSGVSAEGYRGNLPSVGIPVQDSTESASAIIGELSVRSEALYRLNRGGQFFLTVDGGLRQFSAYGFKLREYSPREWVGDLEAGYSWTAGEHVGLFVSSHIRGRQVEDRPPMPLFLQPGYRSGELSGGMTYQGPGGLLYDLTIAVAQSDYLAPQFAPQIRLLDQDQISFEGGATVAAGRVASLRVFGAIEANRYPKQTTFAPEDPFRKDRTFHAGAAFSYQGERLVQLSVEGRANRSNSDRPEYDALTVRGFFWTSLPHQLGFSANGAFTAKKYLHESEFARLLPGEEANNASLVYLSLSRPVATNLDGTVRIGWTRAETEVGDAYFRRFGGSFTLRYRP